MDKCVFCGRGDCTPGRVYCPDCAPVVLRLNDDQLQALEKLQKDEEAREMVKESFVIIRDAVAHFVETVGPILVGVIQTIAPCIEEEVDHHGQ